MFLNITPTVTNWASDNKQFSLVFDENPLADFVELPDDGRAQNELWYSNILCGVLRGALEMVSAGLVFSARHPSLPVRRERVCCGSIADERVLQVQMQVDAHFTSDVLRGNDTTEMRVSLIRLIDDELPPGDD